MDFMELGMLFGIVVGLLIVVIYFGIRRANKESVKEYDERQIAARGKAYICAFYTLIAYLCVAGAAYDIFDFKLFMSFGGIVCGIVLSFLVFIAVLILNDAYVALNSSENRLLLIFAFLLPSNLLGTFRAFLENKLIEEERLTFYVVFPALSVLLLWVIVFILINRFKNRLTEQKEAQNTDDSEDI